ncbi:glycosyltransferase family 4 protein [Mobilicoccus massiliensis]|uniref:glycosyltransferase family 4 protein n=1 Tax=Mobilicoccus massiliensis TaxID=1522310 RepID=UPI00058FBFD0|nr:glycosyltransferase family 4 protein [Mobilicoccus massiliensis]
MTHVLMMVGNTIAHDTRVLKSALAMADGGTQVTLLGASPTNYRQDTWLRDVRIIRVPVTYRLRDRRLRQVHKRTQRRLTLGLPQDAERLIEMEARQRVRERNDLGGRDRELRARWALLRRRLARARNEADNRIGEFETSLNERLTQWWNDHDYGVAWRRDLPEVDDLDIAFTPIIDRIDWDILHSHDIHHVGTAARAVARRRAAGGTGYWIYDAHEYVAGLPVYPPRTKRLIAAWLDLEKEFIHDADAVITVTAPLAEQLRSQYLLPATPTVVMNAPVFSDEIAATEPGLREECGVSGDTRLVVYSGGVTRARGVHTVVEAMPSMPGVHLAVVCVPHNQTRPVRQLAELAEELGVRDRLHLLDPVAPSAVSSYLSGADLGVHPMVHFGSHEFALPNKLFEYLHAGLPLAVSDCRALSEFVRSNEVGAVFTAEDPASCARAILDVLDRRDDLHRRIVEDDTLLEPYSWEHQASRLRGLYRTILGDDSVPREPAAETSLADVAEEFVTRDDRPSVLGIGPTNSAGQAWAWAKAVERHIPGVTTFVLAADRGGSMRFPADEVVPFSVFRQNQRWSAAFRDKATSEWTHALIETGRSLFGTRYGRDFVTDAEVLRAAGVRVGLLFHGSEVRDPAAHAVRNPFSPFVDPEDELTLSLQNQRDILMPKVEIFMQEGKGPVFVSTPDLLEDVPGAVWLPLVVDVDAWAAAPTEFDRDVPVVLHVPSRSRLKGSEVADRLGEALANEGLIDYRRLENVPPSDMRAHVHDSDIVLDQFSIGTHGAAAVEAMAAGRVVLAHIVEEVRTRLPGCPVIEADPDTLADVLRGLIADRDAGRSAARLGQEYVREVHDGRRSAAVLAEHLGLRG